MTRTEADKMRLSQVESLAQINSEIRATEMVTVYLSDHNGDHNYGRCSALIPSDQIGEILDDYSWDVMHGHGFPGSISQYEGDEVITAYHHYGNEFGIEPLVIEHSFHGIRPDYVELSEEFRLFHRLYQDTKLNQHFKFDDDGNEELIAIVTPDQVKIRLKEIRQFLAIKEMHLSIQFDYREHSRYSLDELGLNDEPIQHRDDTTHWSINFGDFGGIGNYMSFSKLTGKKIISPLPKSKSGFPGFAEEEPDQYVDFIVDVDDAGNNIIHSSDPDSLSNNRPSDADARHYLTPVFFRKEVLNKYYGQPSKYSVKSSTLSCASLWSMHLDNNHTDHVSAWLGDLGRDLPYSEQLHWRSYNIAPAGEMSETFVRQQIYAEFAEADRADHLFHSSYHSLKHACDDHLGWQLLLPLAPDDTHYMQVIRIPATGEQRDFDELVLALAKVLVDSLNEKEIAKLISSEGIPTGSIARLELALKERGIKDYEVHIEFLRNLQKLRSSGSAHRKGSNYEKVARSLGLDSVDLRAVFSGFLESAQGILQFFSSVIHDGKLSNDTRN